MEQLPNDEYLAQSVYPILETGLEELLKSYFPPDQLVPNPSRCPETPSDLPAVWLAKWLKARNSTIAQENTRNLSAAVDQLASRCDRDKVSCCKNLVLAVREAFWPVQVLIRALSSTNISLLEAYIAVHDKLTEDVVESMATSNEGPESDQADSEPSMNTITRQVEVELLRYIVSSHPDPGHIRGRL
eukprot:CAMPEP_0113716456 /NCGR_PEP_ID=MMETSP0038_2-20120614/33909_1 /TAXON_ID=2898 /ORGANISM="Cryptomonas paramecium" /LENGTH=186 /DNA_ID=CAMNT_0000643999 /DNA_START=10 /DNA_END=567 /DNA_ORIENTATION=+ /assembly_acc=CAM_ASM_000170